MYLQQKWVVGIGCGYVRHNQTHLPQLSRLQYAESSAAKLVKGSSSSRESPVSNSTGGTGILAWLAYRSSSITMSTSGCLQDAQVELVGVVLTRHEVKGDSEGWLGDFALRSNVLIGWSMEGPDRQMRRTCHPNQAQS